MTEAQQEAFRQFRSVMATPIWDYTENVIGSLTAIAADDDGYFESGAGQAVARELADVVAVLLTALAAEE